MSVVKKFSEIMIGDKIPIVTKKITQEKIDIYAEASGDFNPIHIDEEFARQTPFKGTIAHGLLTLAYISEMMVQWSGKKWFTGGELKLTFLSPVRPGDTIVTGGEVKEKNKEEKQVLLEVSSANQEGKVVAAGNVTVSYE